MLRNQLGLLIDKISKTDKKSVLVDNLYLDSVQEAKIKKQKEVIKRQTTRTDPRKNKITKMVKEFFKEEAEQDKE